MVVDLVASLVASLVVDLVGNSVAWKGESRVVLMAVLKVVRLVEKLGVLMDILRVGSSVLR